MRSIYLFILMLVVFIGCEKSAFDEYGYYPPSLESKVKKMTVSLSSYEVKNNELVYIDSYDYMIVFNEDRLRKILEIIPSESSWFKDSCVFYEYDLYSSSVKLDYIVEGVHSNDSHSYNDIKELYDEYGFNMEHYLFPMKKRLENVWSYNNSVFDTISTNVIMVYSIDASYKYTFNEEGYTEYLVEKTDFYEQHFEYSYEYFE